IIQEDNPEKDNATCFIYPICNMMSIMFFIKHPCGDKMCSESDKGRVHRFHAGDECEKGVH
uniref:hypothetical protein n=1 Tax=Escherichia coli TaxID=562 RepID=UPI0030C75EC0